MDRLDMRTKDLSQEKIRMLGELFPNCITESKVNDGDGEKTVLAVDFDSLRQELSNHVVEGLKERYQFTWPDKNRARAFANTSTTMALRPCREESIEFDSTENLYIEGDNLEVLKILREAYLGKIKMIYIDPPYNTGNDFVYADDYSIDSADYRLKSGDYSNSGDRLVLNSDTNGRFHTDWLNMMYPRLLLSKDFLSDDGIIFISIGNQEIASLKMVMDEIYGHDNCLGIIDWESKTKCQNTRTAKKQLQNKQEYILVYKKRSGRYEFNLKVVGVRDYPDSDDRGTFRLEQVGEMSASGIRGRDSMIFPIMGIMPKQGNQWKIGKNTVEEYMSRGDIMERGGRVFLKIRPEQEEDQTEPFWSFISKDIGTAESANSDLKKMIGMSGFETVKPLNLIKKLIFHSTSENDIVMDFFAGSSTTAHAIFDINREYGTHRRFISIQLPEKCAEHSESKEAGYDYITEIGKKRLKVAINNLRPFRTDGEDLGFRVFKLDSSNMADVFYDPESYKQMDIEQYGNNVKPGRSDEDLLIQAMLGFAIPLSAKIETITVGGVPVSVVNNGFLVACLSNECNESVVTSMVKMNPSYIVIRNGSSMTDQDLANIERMIETSVPKIVSRMF